MLTTLAALGGFAACTTSDAGAPGERAEDRTAAAATATAPLGFTARPRQHLVFTAKPTAPAAEVETYFKANVLPSLVKDRRIGDVTTYVDPKTGGYIVELELRTPAPAQLSFALDVLSVGRTQADAEKIVGEFSKFFATGEAQQLVPRADLSINRRVIGTVTGAK